MLLLSDIPEEGDVDFVPKDSVSTWNICGWCSRVRLATSLDKSCPRLSLTGFLSSIDSLNSPTFLRGIFAVNSILTHQHRYIDSKWRTLKYRVSQSEGSEDSTVLEKKLLLVMLTESTS